MTNDLAIYNAPVPDRMRYAEALSGASLLPDSYRGKPANLLLALEYGGALGIAPMVAVQEIHVIKGKPTLSALLQAALVRRAGHKLRVTGDHTTATCQIIRADDPDFTFETTWTLDRAKAAGLLTNDSWRKYPDNMLKARAISECVRNACPDVIAGFGYTAEEMGDDTVDPFPQTDSGVGAASGESHPATGAGDTAPESHIEDAVIVDETTGELGRANPNIAAGRVDAAAVAAEVSAAVGGGEAPAAADPADYQSPPFVTPGGAPTKKQSDLMWLLLGKAYGDDVELKRAAISDALGRDVESTKTLTSRDVSTVIDALKAAS